MAKTILKSKNAFDKICSKKFKYSELVLLATSNKYLSEQEKLDKKKAGALMYKLKQRGLSVQNYEAVILMIEQELGPKAVQHRNAKTHDVGYGKPPVESQFKKGQSGNPAGRPKNETKQLGAVTGRIPCNCENKCTMPRTVKSNTFGLLSKSTNRIKIIGSLDKTIGYLECLKDHGQVAKLPYATKNIDNYEVVEVFYKRIDTTVQGT